MLEFATSTRLDSYARTLITANKEKTAAISGINDDRDDEANEWSWMIYPHKVRFLGVPFEQKDNQIHIEITEELLDEYDITFYSGEHFDIFGALTITNNQIKISGEVCYHISGKKLYSLEIIAERR